MNEVKCSAFSGMPSGSSSGPSSAETVGSPTHPSPSDAIVMPSWQQAR